MDTFADSFIGIYVPQSDTLFLFFVSLHILAGLTAIVSGALTALARKRPGPHPKRGTVYYWALFAVFYTAIALTIIRWPHANLLLSLGVFAFLLATFGRVARRRQWSNWVYYHGSSMGASYIVMLIAFYVDNGPHLPIWRELSNWMYWALPIVIGIPLIALALVRFSKHNKH